LTLKLETATRYNLDLDLSAVTCLAVCKGRILIGTKYGTVIKIEIDNPSTACRYPISESGITSIRLHPELIETCDEEQTYGLRALICYGQENLTAGFIWKCDFSHEKIKRDFKVHDACFVVKKNRQYTLTVGFCQDGRLSHHNDMTKKTTNVSGCSVLDVSKDGVILICDGDGLLCLEGTSEPYLKMDDISIGNSLENNYGGLGQLMFWRNEHFIVYAGSKDFELNISKINKTKPETIEEHFEWQAIVGGDTLITSISSSQGRIVVAVTDCVITFLVRCKAQENNLRAILDPLG